MAINVSNPTVVPGSSQVTYNEFWVSYLQIVAGNPNSAITGVVRMRKVGTTGGRKQFAPGVEAILKIDDLTALGAQYPNLDAAVTALYSALLEIAEDRGLL